MATADERLHQQFLRRVAAGEFPPPVAPGAEQGIDTAVLRDLFESQCLSRHADFAARRLKARGLGFYTIASAGHEGNAAFGHVFRPTDMAFLHYRSGAFVIQRAKHLPGQHPVRDLLLSMVASGDDPVSGGRHKVLGNAAAMIPPQTSTIASHLPKAMGTALAIDLARRMAVTGVLPPDAVAICSFGDASANHSTALGAINAASWYAVQGVPVPVVFICEDNGLGISVPTPAGWIARAFSNRPGLEYVHCDGLDLADSLRGARAAAALARERRVPVFLHARMVRLMGHAGEDNEADYRDSDAIGADEDNDPLLHGARHLLAAGLTAGDIIALYERAGAEVARLAADAATRPKLSTRAEILSTLLPPRRAAASVPAPAPAAIGDGRPLTLSRHLNLVLGELLSTCPELALCGQDIGRKGGVYGITQGLQRRHGPDRVMDTLLDEQSILGLAMGMAHNGLLAIPEIQFLAYLHNALDQVRGEAATLPFFSRGAFASPMVVRLPGLAYQKGFGGHFHNDNSVTALRDLPGILLACPANGADAAAMLRGCVRLAREEGRVTLFLEPIALYYTRDLHETGDGLWLSPYAAGMELAPGMVGVHGEGTDLCILTYGNGVFLSRQAAKILGDEHGLALRIVDLRWLAPLPRQAILDAVAPCTRILVVDEGRESGSVSEALCTLLLEAGIGKPIRRVTGADSFIPLGDAARLVLPSRDEIIAAAIAVDGSWPG